MSKLKIGYFGDGPWASIALERLLSRSTDFEIAFVVPRFDSQDPKLRQLAASAQCPFIVNSDVNSAEAREELAEFGADIFVSMSFNQILRSSFLSIPPMGVINCHARALPRYRGRNVLNWAIINGENEFGITVHYVDEGIDTGDIVHQRNIPITERENYSDLLKIAHTECANVLIESLDMIKDEKIVRKPQSLFGHGFYCGRRRDGDEWVDWGWTSKRIRDFVRGICDPGPGAQFAINNDIFTCQAAEIIEECPVYIGNEGEVVGRDDTGVIVKTGDTALRLTLCRRPGESQTNFTPKWPIGKRLMGRLEYRLFRLEKMSEEAVSGAE